MLLTFLLRTYRRCQQLSHRDHSAYPYKVFNQNAMPLFLLKQMIVKCIQPSWGVLLDLLPTPTPGQNGLFLRRLSWLVGEPSEPRFNSSWRTFLVPKALLWEHKKPLMNYKAGLVRSCTFQKMHVKHEVEICLVLLSCPVLSWNNPAFANRCM